jgi:K+-sensing histidine kinase KdpD
VAVKGSKVTPMRVIPYSPFASAMRIVAVLVVFTLAVPASYFVGAYLERQRESSQGNSQDQEHQKIVASLNQEIAQLRTGTDIDRQSMEDLRQVVMTQKAQLNATERDLKVYKDLLSPGAKTNPLGISFGVFTVLPLKDAGHFSYSLTVQKLATKEADFDGSLEFRIIGLQAGKPLQLSLYQVSSQVSVPSIPLNFKYFQALEGDLTLPVDFVPQSVELVVKTIDKKSPPLVTAELDWPISATKIK